MNLHGAAIKTSAVRLVTALMVPFTAVYRPTGAAYYRICYALFGWHPFGFRFVTYLLICANIGFVYAMMRRLSATSEQSFGSALLFSFHGRLWPIYLSNGTVYDVLCVFFGLWTIWYYVSVRLKCGAFTWKQNAVQVALFVAALNAKEMTAMLPAIFIIFDWLYVCPGSIRLRERVRWMVHNSKMPVLLAFIVAGAFLGKTGSDGPLATPGYAAVFSLKQFFFNAKLIYSDLFYLRFMQLNGRKVVLLWIVVFVVAALSKRRLLLFLAWFALLAPLPIMFMGWRGFYVMYFPLAAWASYIAVVLVLARDRLVKQYPQWRTAAQVALTGLLVAIVCSGLRDPIFRAGKFDTKKSAAIDAGKNDFLTLNEPLPHGANILLLNSRFSGDLDRWYPVMIAQLLYRDPDLQLDRASMMPPLNEATIASYDRVIDFQNGRLVVVRRLPDRLGQDLHRPSTSPVW